MREEFTATKYTCDSCGHSSTEADEFRRFIGNVMVCDGGGLIGNNIISDDEDIYSRLEENKGTEFVIGSKDDTLRIYACDICLNCICRILGIEVIEGEALNTLK